MNVIFKFLFGLLTDPLGLPVVWWIDWLILLVIGGAAYLLAFRLVGDMYSSDRISTKTGGSAAHWLIRLFFFFAVWAVTYGLIWVGKLVIAHRLAALIGFAGLLFVGGLVVLIVLKRRKGGDINA